MTKLGIVSLPTVLVVASLGSFPLRAATPTPAPDFKEVYDLIRGHLAEMNDAEMNRIAVQSLISALSPKVSLAGAPTTESTKEGSLVTQSSLFEGAIGYVRVKQVGEALDKAIRQAWQELGATNTLNGMVIDLRYAGGTDYAAAAAAADLFIRKEQPLLDWGQGQVRSKEKTDSIAVPLAVLVNRQTSAAAEALAAVLRETGAGLILGSRTAGEATIAQEYPLKDGERLRIATAPVQLGDGSALPSQGLKPDIAVEVSAEDERVYYADAFKELAKPSLPASGALVATNLAQGTNRTRRPRFNEAELVRERRDGLVLDSDVSGASSGDSEKPAVRDPVLARALDFLKGLTVMRQTRS
jgi:hypothetical protein